MEYIKASDAAARWGVPENIVLALCTCGMIGGAVISENVYMIPTGTEMPTLDGSDRLARLLDIERKREILASMPPLPTDVVEGLAREFTADYTYNSNAIEGNILTADETARLLDGAELADKPTKDRLEALGHRDGFLYVRQLAREGVALSESVVKGVHSHVLMDRPERAGSYRNVPVYIVGAYTRPPQPYLVGLKMYDLIAANEKRKQGMNTIERIARFHLEFESIHPFIDGNGRTGRLLLNLELIQNGYPPINVKYADRGRYYAAFTAFCRDGNAGEMIDLISEYLTIALDEWLGLWGDI